MYLDPVFTLLRNHPKKNMYTCKQICMYKMSMLDFFFITAKNKKKLTYG